jgi:CheY-like chemotaxis protein
MISLMVESPELYDGVFPPQAAAHLRIVYRTCQHLAGMIDDVLDMSQVEAGRMTLHYTQANLAEVLHAALDLVRPVLAEKGLTCQVEVPNTLPVVACDVVRIRQIVLNLLSNAARLTTQGGITLKAERELASVVLSVADTGPGIAPEAAECIFEPYYRGAVSSLTWQDNKGSGLGLSISKQLVTLHGGEMWLESTPGEGTTFYVRLPFSPPDGPVAAPNRWIREEWLWHDRESRPSFALSHYKPRIVICDQVGGLYATLSRVTDRVEFVETRALSQALTELQHNAAQVLLLNAPTLSALWDAARKAAREAPDVPILGCLCSSGIADRLPTKTSTYLIKPITRDRLHTAMESLTQSINRVLIVDDDADTRELLSLYVQAYDVMVDVVMAENGEQALALLRETHPDLVLLDLVMGEIDGWQVLEAKQNDEELEDIPVIIITAQDPNPEPPRSRVLLTTVGDGIALDKLVDGAAVLSAVMSGTL